MPVLVVQMKAQIRLLFVHPIPLPASMTGARRGRTLTRNASIAIVRAAQASSAATKASVPVNAGFRRASVCNRRLLTEYGMDCRRYRLNGIRGRVPF